jgi:hypothetical protein
MGLSQDTAIEYGGDLNSFNTTTNRIYDNVAFLSSAATDATSFLCAFHPPSKLMSQMSQSCFVLAGEQKVDQLSAGQT